MITVIKGEVDDSIPMADMKDGLIYQIVSTSWPTSVEDVGKFIQRAGTTHICMIGSEYYWSNRAGSAGVKVKLVPSGTQFEIVQ